MKGFFWRGFVAVFVALLMACSQQDQLQLHFENAADKDAAQSIVVSAIAPLTSDGQLLTCDSYLQADSGVDSSAIDVVKSSTVDVKQHQSSPNLLVHLPQGDYLFLAEAFDDFGFTLARGCRSGSLAANAVLQLDIALQSVPAPKGTLTLLGPDHWLQHAGVSALGAAPSISVQALDLQGQPLGQVEVRLRVSSGEAVPLNMVMRTDAQGQASSQVLVSSGQAVLQVHARGLQGSPITISITGLPSPEYRIIDRDLGGTAVSLLAANFHFDDYASTDVLVVSQQQDAGVASIWRAAPDSQGLWYEQWQVLEGRPTQAIAGQFDPDTRPDLLVAAEDESGPTLMIYHHDENDGDSFYNGVSEALPRDIDAVLQVAAGRCGGDPGEGQDLFAIVEANGQRDLLLWHNVGGLDPYHFPALVLVQRRALPSFALDAQMRLADLDTDGDDDLLLESAYSGVWIVPCGNDASGMGTGQFFAPTEIGRSDWPHILTQPGTNHVVAGDINADGFQDLLLVSDLVVLEGDVSWRVALGDGRLAGFHFSSPTTLPLPGAAQILLADINADGFQDLVIAGRRPPEQLVLLGGDGDGNFAAPLIFNTGLSNVQIVSADLNLDGIADIVVLGETLEGFLVQSLQSTDLIK